MMRSASTGHKKIRFVMVGGFLGAGKTTTIGRLARAYRDRGLKVAIVTNDQASNLVDTQTLRAQGFDVGEVAGACFCCNFDELTRTVASLEHQTIPDVVLAEPVGSCTDLAATVIQPLFRLHGEKFDVAPYGVILKPSHGRRILGHECDGGGFSPQAAYIFKKQLEEADFILINRIDELPPDQIDQLAQLVERHAPGVPVLRISARTGQGFDSLLEVLDQRGVFGRRILDLDYDTYAQGEAELGWLNSSLRISASQPYALDEFLLSIVDQLRQRLSAEGAETAHLKTIGLWEGYHGVANLISSDAPAELSLPSQCHTKTADLIVNARVAMDPQRLSVLVDEAIAAACSTVAATAYTIQTQSFRPGRPVPTHRYDVAYTGERMKAEG